MKKQASIAEARDQLSALVNTVAHGRQRITLTSRGRPKAALIGLEDLAALEGMSISEGGDDSVLNEADALRERILLRRKGVMLDDSANDLAVVREQRSQ